MWSYIYINGRNYLNTYGEFTLDHYEYFTTGETFDWAIGTNGGSYICGTTPVSIVIEEVP
jgi:hypothetical protein